MSTKVIEVKSDAFNRALLGIMATSKREPEAVAREAFRGVVRRLIEVTPPGSPKAGLKGAKAAANARAKVKGDILRLMQGVRENQAQRTDIEAIHQAARVNGVVPKSTTVNNYPAQFDRIPVPGRSLTAYIKKVQMKVGTLASGWRAAAAKFNVTLPKWIDRNKAGSAIDITTNEKGFRIVASNKAEFASDVRIMGNRIQLALNIQGKRMKRRLADYVKAQTAKLGKSA